MSQKIKKQIKHTVPGFVILCLINLLVVGLFFNNLNLPDLTFGTPQVNADTATTSVTVKNAPPNWSIYPAENPVSSSTAPINTGASISFSAQATDPETNQYYLLVCSTNAATPHNGAAPTCDVTQRCVSAATNSGSTANCTYSNVQDANETQDWYAFVCDNHATEADCQVSSQGSGDSGSPIYVNHPPALSSVVTSDNNKVPGGTFTVSSSALDHDTQGGADQVTLYICDSNSFATTTGCASGHELCHATSTTDPSCQFTDVAPTPDQAYTYYSFSYDNHYHASTNTPTATYTIINVAPQVSNVVLSASYMAANNINPGIKNGTTTTTIYATSTSVTDANGCTDLNHATATIFMSSTGHNCTADGNNCYQIAQANCAITDCSGDGQADNTATYTCQATMQNFATPTDASTGNPRTAQTWYARITAFDEALNGSATSTTGVDVYTVTALEVTENTIPYGTIKSGQNSGTANATTTVVNYGNAPLDSGVIGIDMTGAGTIKVWNQSYSTSNFTYPSANTLTSTTTTSGGLSIPRPTSATDVTAPIYWGIGIPGGTPSGSYTGTNTFTATLKDTGNWN